MRCYNHARPRVLWLLSVAKPGQGGMGEVYKARDARLDRAVGAGKVLSAIEERRARLGVGDLIRPPRARGEEVVSHER